MKWEWKKQEKEIYLPKTVPQVLQVPPFRFVEIRGRGNPNEEPFKRHIETLYTLSYTLRMMPKKGITPEGYFEYTVYPLEGLWTLSEPWAPGTPLDKSKLEYRLMIRQPDFCDAALFDLMRDMAQKKLEADLLEAAALVEIEDGLCVQMMHLGPYDDEPHSFAKMAEFLAAGGLRRRSMEHREIYHSDPRKAIPDKMRTVLREFVEKAPTAP